MKDDTKKIPTVFLVLNILVLYSSPAFLICGIFPSFNFPILIAIVILAALTGSFSRFYRKWETGRKRLVICRILLISAVFLMFFSVYMLIGFNETKAFYPIKRFYYEKSVSSFRTNIDSFMPEKLPENAEDYYFKSEHSFFPIQDYCKITILAFRTDSATIADFEAECKAKGGIAVPFITTFEEYLKANNLLDSTGDKEFMTQMKREFLVNRNAPINFYRVLPDEIIDDISDNSVIYSVNEWNNKTDFPADYRYVYEGYLFDYDSGIVIIWG